MSNSTVSQSSQRYLARLLVKHDSKYRSGVAESWLLAWALDAAVSSSPLILAAVVTAVESVPHVKSLQMFSPPPPPPPDDRPLFPQMGNFKQHILSAFSLICFSAYAVACQRNLLTKCPPSFSEIAELLSGFPAIITFQSGFKPFSNASEWKDAALDVNHEQCVEWFKENEEKVSRISEIVTQTEDDVLKAIAENIQYMQGHYNPSAANAPANMNRIQAEFGLLWNMKEGQPIKGIMIENKDLSDFIRRSDVLFGERIRLLETDLIHLREQGLILKPFDYINVDGNFFQVDGLGLGQSTDNFLGV